MDTDRRLSLKFLRSNIEWRLWGVVDPLYGVASLPGKARRDAQPWTMDEFLKTGELSWNIFRPRWEHYGVMRHSCVEIGCGAGRFTKQLAGFFSEVIGVDVSEQMLEIAKANVPEAKFCLVDTPQLPIDDQSVTAAFSCEVFQHFSSPKIAEGYFRETFRVLRPGGSFLIQVPLVVFPHRWPYVYRCIHRVARFRNSLRAEGRRLLIGMGARRPFMHGISYNMDWLLPLLGAIGFTGVEAGFFSVTGDDGNVSSKSTPFLTSHVFARRPS